MSNLLNAVIEIDEVEFLITETSAKQIAAREALVLLHCLVDSKNMVFPLDIAEKAIKNGIVDRIGKV